MQNNGFKIVPAQELKAIMLANFFCRIKHNKFFRPHPFTNKAAMDLMLYPTENIYYTIVEDDKIIGYGFLRGFEEKWDDICLGIYILDRNKGLGTLLVNFLHTVAKRKGLKKLRLHVHPDNKKALGLYRKMGYQFNGEKHNGEMVGICTL